MEASGKVVARKAFISLTKCDLNNCSLRAKWPYRFPIYYFDFLGINKRLTLERKCNNLLHESTKLIHIIKTVDYREIKSSVCARRPEREKQAWGIVN